MSIAGRKVPFWVVALAAALMVVGAVLPALTTGGLPEALETREIHLVARNMAFYLESDPTTPNPTIEVRAGERVTVTLRNDERGMTHDFAAPALTAALEPLKFGESHAVTFTVPQGPGTYEYVCRPHQLMMRGLIVVK